jgi:hypothetical protein
MFVVGVYVTSRYKNYPEFKVTLDEALKKYIPTGKPNALCTGSSKGNESGNGLVKKYAFEHGIPCRVFETQWANNIPTKPGKKNTAGVRANAMIIRNANACVLFWTPTAIAKWDFMSGGCYNFRKMCGKMGRELIEVKVDIYKEIEKDVEDEKLTTLPDREELGGGFGGGDMPFGGGEPMGRGGDSPLSDLGGGGGYSGGSVPAGVSAPSVPHGGESDGNVSPDMEGGMDSETSMQNNPSGMSSGIPNTGSGISEIPVDINGDGTPDTSITAMDTTGDGVPDSQLTPVDVDNNGTIDKIELTPLPQTNQTPPPQQTAAAAPQQTQVAAPAVQNSPSTATPQTDDENATQQ